MCSSINSSEDSVNIPALSMPKHMVSSFKKVDDESILYFIDNKNPHIKSALNNFFKKNEKHRSRKNKEHKV
jgi:hypothetical protein